mmetsp:Transcript_174066/g.552658  ORF Transcript_174066/g.552658 Transcript_174066/m.552658 type:complete len:239 (+) Transcript_174066:632-1348(+)
MASFPTTLRRSATRGCCLVPTSRTFASSARGAERPLARSPIRSSVSKAPRACREIASSSTLVGPPLCPPARRILSASSASTTRLARTRVAALRIRVAAWQWCVRRPRSSSHTPSRSGSWESRIRLHWRCLTRPQTFSSRVSLCSSSSHTLAHGRRSTTRMSSCTGSTRSGRATGRSVSTPSTGITAIARSPPVGTWSSPSGRTTRRRFAPSGRACELPGAWKRRSRRRPKRSRRSRVI